MRELYRNQGSASIGTTSTQLLGPNEKRWGIVVSAPENNPLTLSFNGPATARQGIVLWPKTQPLILTMEHIGQAIREEINALVETTGETIGIVEIFEVDCSCNPATMIYKRG